jgi:hypothetical protein
LAEFPLAKLQGESHDHLLARLELGAKNVMGSYGRMEHEACIQEVPNGGRLNQVFNKAGMVYGPRAEPSIEASTEATRKRKANTGIVTEPPPPLEMRGPSYRIWIG